MNVPRITSAQVTRLAVLYGQYERHSLDAPGADRIARLTWASEATGRKIESFKDLTLEEGKRLIDTLQGQLGTKVPSKTPRRRPDRREAQKMGTEGRHDQIHDETTIVGPQALAMIQRDMSRLGWDQRRLDAFLASTRSPIKPSQTIRTLREANRVHWALKRLKPDSQQAKS